MADHWTKNRFQDDEVQFEPYTDFQFLFYAGAGLGILVVVACLFGLLAEQRWEYAAAISLGIGLTWLSLKLATQLHEIYRVGSDGVVFDRTFLGWRFSNRIVDLNGLHCVIVDAKPHFGLGSARRGTKPPDGWSYGLALVLRSGKVVRLTETDERNFEKAVQVATRFARRYELSLDEPASEKYVRISGRNPPAVTHEDWKPMPL